MKKSLVFAFSACSFLGLLKIFSIVPFDRMSADDFNFTTLAMKQGLLKAQLSWYFGITGRFTTNFLQSVFGLLSSGSGKTSLFFIITTALLLLSFILFFRNLAKSKLNILHLLLISAVSFATYYLVTPDKNESWYWLTGSLTYLWPTILGLMIFSLLMWEGKSVLVYISLFILSFFAMGGNEIFSLMFNVVLGLLIVFLAIKKYLDVRQKKPLVVAKSLFVDDVFFKRLLVVFIASLLGFSLMYFAPGNAVRIKGPGSDEMSFVGSIAYSIQKGPELVYSIFINNALYLMTFILVLASFFSILGVGVGDGISEKEKIMTRIFFVTLAPIILSVFFMLPGYRALGRIPPSRAFITLSFVLLITLIFDSYYLAKLFAILKTEHSFVFKLFIFGSSFLFFVASLAFTPTFAEDIYIAKNYSASFDKLFIQLKKEALKNNKNQVILVSEPPPSGLVHSEKLNKDPNHWANVPFSNFFSLKGISVIDKEATPSGIAN